METLAVIAYKQPITKAEIEEVRGVNSEDTTKRLDEIMPDQHGRSTGKHAHNRTAFIGMDEPCGVRIHRRVCGDCYSCRRGRPDSLPSPK